MKNQWDTHIHRNKSEFSLPWKVLIGKGATKFCYKPTSINVNHLKPEKKNMDSQEKGTTQTTSVFLHLIFNFFQNLKIIYDVFELWCWRRLLRVPWTARRSNQSILKEISPGISLEGIMLKLKRIVWPPHAKSWLIGKDWCWEGLGAGGEEDDRGWDGWMASRSRWTWVSVNSGSWWWTGRPGVLRFMGSQRVGHNWATELNWKMDCIIVNSTLFKTLPIRIIKEPGGTKMSK